LDTLIPSSADLAGDPAVISRAEALRPIVEAAADEIEDKRRLPPALLDKLHEARLLPLHPSTVKQLLRYHRKRQAHFPKAKIFFVSMRGTGLGVNTVEIVFHRLAAGERSRFAPPPAPDGSASHCQVLLKWSRQHQDIDHDLLLLMRYLGHSKIRDTYWYLTGVPELLRRAAARWWDGPL